MLVGGSGNTLTLGPYIGTGPVLRSRSQDKRSGMDDRRE